MNPAPLTLPVGAVGNRSLGWWGLLTLILTEAILIGSSVMVWAAERALKKQSRPVALGFMTASIVMGSAFAVIQLHEWRSKTYGPTTNQYGSVYFTVTGFHLAHVFIGLLILVSLTFWITRGMLDHRRHAALTIGAMYWHFVDAVWLFVFTTFYLTPYIFEH